VIKTRLRDSERVRAALREWSAPRQSTHIDTYYDFPDERLGAALRELRLRTVSGAGPNRHVLTFQDGPSADATYETSAGHAEPLHTVFNALGLRPLVAFVAYRTEYHFVHGDREILATVVRVPELPQEFLELEELNVEAGSEAVHRVLAELGIPGEDVTEEDYAQAVAAARLKA
jgi:adenylate cyclase class 2